jgi:hypothetical protein
MTWPADHAFYRLSKFGRVHFTYSILSLNLAAWFIGKVGLFASASHHSHW